MDPKANLDEQREIYRRIIARADQEYCPGDDVEEDDAREADAARLAELAQALDEWLCGGGFLPKDWSKL